MKFIKFCGNHVIKIYYFHIIFYENHFIRLEYEALNHNIQKIILKKMCLKYSYIKKKHSLKCIITKRIK